MLLLNIAIGTVCALLAFALFWFTAPPRMTEGMEPEISSVPEASSTSKSSAPLEWEEQLSRTQAQLNALEEAHADSDLAHAERYAALLDNYNRLIESLNLSVEGASQATDARASLSSALNQL